jgi:sporulation protein YlmC with PRC-barrel domain
MGAALLPTLMLNHETARNNLHGRSAGFAERHGSAGGLPIADAKLEEAILQNPGLRGPANRQSVRDLRSLRDAAFTLWS